MDALAVVLVGVGAALMYFAYKGELHPVTHAKTSLTNVSPTSGSGG